MLYSRRTEASTPSESATCQKVIVTDVGVKRLTVCESCGEEKYVAEGESVCDECRLHPKRKRKAKS